MEKFAITINWQTRIGVKQGVSLSVDDVVYAGKMIDSMRDISLEIKSVKDIKNVVRMELWKSNGPYAEFSANISNEIFEAIKEILVRNKQQKIEKMLEKLDKLGFFIEVSAEGEEGK